MPPRYSRTILHHCCTFFGNVVCRKVDFAFHPGRSVASIGIPPKGQHLADSVNKQLAVTCRRRPYAVSVLVVAVGVPLLMTVGVGAPDHQAQ